MRALQQLLTLHSAVGASPPPTVGPHWYKVADEGETVNVTGNIRFGSAYHWTAPQAVSGSVVATSAAFGVSFDAHLQKQLQCDSESYARRDVKVMPLGDSVTYLDDANGYRIQLAALLAARSDLKSIDYVGNAEIYENDNNALFDNDHNGYPSYTVAFLTNPPGTHSHGAGPPPGNDTFPLYWGDQGDLDDWFVGTASDIVLFHLGTNDCRNGTPDFFDTSYVVNTLMPCFTLVLERARTQNPNVVFMVAQIIGLTDTQGNTNVGIFNAEIPAWAAANTTTQSPVIVVDQYTGFDPSTMTYDGVHTNPTGATHMANAWMAAMEPYIVASGIHGYNLSLLTYYDGAYPYLNLAKVPGLGWASVGSASGNNEGWLTGLLPGESADAVIVINMPDYWGFFPPGDYEVVSTSGATLTPHCDDSGVDTITPGVGQAFFTAHLLSTGTWGSFNLRCRFTNSTGSPIDILDCRINKISDRAAVVADPLAPRPEHLSNYSGAKTLRVHDWIRTDSDGIGHARRFTEFPQALTRNGYCQQNEPPGTGTMPLAAAVKFASEAGSRPWFNVPSGGGQFIFKYVRATNTFERWWYYADANALYGPIPADLVEGEHIRVFTFMPIAGLYPMVTGDMVYVKNYTSSNFQVSLTNGGSPIVFTNSKPRVTTTGHFTAGSSGVITGIPSTANLGVGSAMWEPSAPVVTTGHFTAGSAVVTGIPDTSGIIVGTPMWEPDQFGSLTGYVASVDSSTQVTMNKADNVTPYSSGSTGTFNITFSGWLSGFVASVDSSSQVYVVRADRTDLPYTASNTGTFPIAFNSDLEYLLGGTSYASFASMDVDIYNDMALPFMQAIKDADPSCQPCFEPGNEVWGAGFPSTNWLHWVGGYLSGHDQNQTQGLGWWMLQLWKAAIAVFGTGNFTLVHPGQGSFFNGLGDSFDYVDPGILNSGVTLKQQYIDALAADAAANRTIPAVTYCIATYLGNVGNTDTDNLNGFCFQQAYTDNGNSTTIPSSYWDTKFDSEINWTKKVLWAGGGPNTSDLDSVSAKVPGISISLYEWGQQLTATGNANAMAVAIDFRDNYLNAQPCADMFERYWQTVIEPIIDRMYTMNHFAGSGLQSVGLSHFYCWGIVAGDCVEVPRSLWWKTK